MAQTNRGLYFLKDKKAQVYKHHKGGTGPVGRVGPSEKGYRKAAENRLEEER